MPTSYRPPLMTGRAPATTSVRGHLGWRRRVARSIVLAVAMTAAVPALAACGSSGDETGEVEQDSSTTTEAAPTTTTTAEAAATTAPPTEEEIVVQTVEDMWLMLKTVSAAPDPNNPELAKYLTGEQLPRSRGVLAEWQSKGYAVVDGPDKKWEHRPKLTSLEGDAASLVDCATDDGWLVRPAGPGAASELVDGTELVALWSISMVKEDGVWKVSDLTRTDVWYSGDPGCVPGW